jgi:hypothetical protein
MPHVTYHFHLPPTLSVSLFAVCMLGSSVRSAKAIASTVCLTKVVLQRHLQLFWVHLIERVEVEQQQTL